MILVEQGKQIHPGAKLLKMQKILRKINVRFQQGKHNLATLALY